MGQANEKGLAAGSLWQPLSLSFRHFYSYTFSLCIHCSTFFLLLLLLIVAKCIEMQCVTAASEQLSLGASSGAIAQQQERNEEDCREIDRKRPMPCATTIGAFHSNGDVIYCVDATITYCLYNMVFASIHCISIGFFFFYFLFAVKFSREHQKDTTLIMVNEQNKGFYYLLLHIIVCFMAEKK